MNNREWNKRIFHVEYFHTAKWEKKIGDVTVFCFYQKTLKVWILKKVEGSSELNCYVVWVGGAYSLLLSITLTLANQGSSCMWQRADSAFLRVLHCLVTRREQRVNWYLASSVSELAALQLASVTWSRRRTDLWVKKSREV